jgi:hypothetical protein
MSKFLWIISSTAFLLAIIILIMSFTSKGTETPEYTVLQKIGDVEIRSYPSMVVAKTSLSNNSFDKQGSTGFRTIAGYIFGGNEKNEKIAMTSPVVMNMGDSASMYFVMPKSYKQEDLPVPSSSQVKIVAEASKTLAVVTYGGYSSDKKIEAHVEKLKETLKKKGIQTKGDFLYMGYNAPWDVIDRRNEVAIEVVLGL